jgi:hypothetical protein
LQSWICRKFRITLGAAGTRFSCIWRRCVNFILFVIYILLSS